MYLLWQHLDSGETADGALPMDEFKERRMPLRMMFENNYQEEFERLVKN